MKHKHITYTGDLDEETNKITVSPNTPLEYLGVELEQADNSKVQKKPKAQVYADWFYIYDYWKYQKRLDISDDDIFIDLELSNDDFYKKDNIRKIRDKMIYFIDKLGYKELITGVKIS